MAKQFYTERDIVDMARSGAMSLEVGENVVLTELAYEKARSLGVTLVQSRADNPPCAPVRPYLSATHDRRAAEPARQGPVGFMPRETETARSRAAEAETMRERIRNAVVARLGNQVDANLLDVIIRRVLNSTGTKEPACCSAESGAPPCAPSNTPAQRG